MVYETHMGRVQDMVTGLLNGSSSMIPLFFKSRGVGFAVENRKKRLHTFNNGEIFTNNCKIKRKKRIYWRALTTFVVKKLTFPVGFQVAVDGWWRDIAETTGPVTQGGTTALTGR